MWFRDKAFRASAPQKSSPGLPAQSPGVEIDLLFRFRVLVVSFC